VYARYLALGRGPELEAAGVTDPDSFGALYWSQQSSVAATLFAITTVSGLGGAVLYGVTRPKPTVPGATLTTTA
jgi:hypothetical protein